MILKNSPDLEVSLELLGAVNGIVTGSGSLLTIRLGNTTKKILVDYGLFQERDKEYSQFLNERRINELNRSEIDYVFLTHSHLDHCGALPMLYRMYTNSNPYTGKIYGSEETLKQAEYILLDSAKVCSDQTLIKEAYGIEHEIKKAENKANGSNMSIKDRSEIEKLYSDLEEIQSEILYLVQDAEMTINSFHPIPIDTDYSLCPGINVKLVPNSHINGATMVEIFINYGTESYGICFTGDIGKKDSPLYNSFQYYDEPRIDTLLMESLHGTELPPETYLDSIDKLEKIIKHAQKRGKSVYIPVFALDRSAILIMAINRLFEKGLSFSCAFDTKLGIQEFELYRNYYLNCESKWFNYNKLFPFDTQRIRFIHDYQEHMDLVKDKKPTVVITASCMGYGGRVFDYFKHHIEDDNAIFVFPGFLPEDCPSKVLLDSPQHKIIEHDAIYALDDRRMVKRCETVQLEGFSSHGYFEDKLNIVNRYSNVSKIILNHGDFDSVNAIANELKNHTRAEVVVP